MARHRHQDAQKRWTTYYDDTRLDDLEKRVAALESPVVVPPDPTEPPAAGSLFDVLAAAGPGAVIDLGSREYTAGAEILKPVTLRNGLIRQGGTALHLKADDIILDGLDFVGGADTVKLYPGRMRTLRNLIFTAMTETTLRFLPGAHESIFEDSVIRQSVATGNGYSPLGANDQGRGVGTFVGLIIRRNTIDSGPPIVSHFGTEVWGVAQLLIEDNRFLGSDVHISIPRSDGAIIRRNTFDLTQTPWAAIELADVENAQVIDNEATGNGPTGPMWNAFVQMNRGSGAVRNNTIARNRLTNFAALVNADGDGHTIVDNCLQNVGRLNWGNFTGPVTVSGNGVCS